MMQNKLELILYNADFQTKFNRCLFFTLADPFCVRLKNRKDLFSMGNLLIQGIGDDIYSINSNPSNRHSANYLRDSRC